jgi:hypothetical protein
MKKWRDIPRSEKWMLVIIVLLLIGVLIRATAVGEGIRRGFGWFFRDDKPLTEIAPPVADTP